MDPTTFTASQNVGATHSGSQIAGTEPIEEAEQTVMPDRKKRAKQGTSPRNCGSRTCAWLPGYERLKNFILRTFKSVSLPHTFEDKVAALEGLAEPLRAGALNALIGSFETGALTGEAKTLHAQAAFRALLGALRTLPPNDRYESFLRLLRIAARPPGPRASASASDLDAAGLFALSLPALPWYEWNSAMKELISIAERGLDAAEPADKYKAQIRRNDIYSALSEALRYCSYETLRVAPGFEADARATLDEMRRALRLVSPAPNRYGRTDKPFSV